MSNTITTRQATIDDLHALAELFDQYRCFYEQSSDVAAARDFIHARFKHHQSVFFIGLVNDEPSGFVQLYPVFSSVRMNRVWLLNDLYVASSGRGIGLGEQLMQAATSFAKSTGASYLTLETGADNHSAQRLYERLGWEREDNFHYAMGLDD